MYDPLDDIMANRQTVLEIVLSRLHIPREVYELRYSLFLRAANLYYRLTIPRDLIEPFPSCFYDIPTRTRRYDDLKLCIESVPTLKEINVRIYFPDILVEPITLNNCLFGDNSK